MSGRVRKLGLKGSSPPYPSNGVHSVDREDLVIDSSQALSEIDAHFNLDDYDEEVEAITSPGSSLEFSLSKYDLPPLGTKKLSGQHYYVNYNSTESGSSEFLPVDDQLPESVHNKLYDGAFVPLDRREVTERDLDVGEVISDGTGSGHVFCDCADCISQADVLVCECENCVHTRERTAGSPRQREVTCDCEDCLNHSGSSYVCECENCLTGSREIHDSYEETTLNNNPPDILCKCDKCLASNAHDRGEACSCHNCLHDVFDEKLVISKRTGFHVVQGHRSSPQGMSQEFQHQDTIEEEFGEELEQEGAELEQKGAEPERFHYHSDHRDGVYGEYGDESELQYYHDEHLGHRDRCRHCDVGHSLDEHCALDAVPDEEEEEEERLYTAGSMEAGRCMCRACLEDQLPHPHRIIHQPINVSIGGLLEDQLQRAEQDLKKKGQNYENEINLLRKENEKAQKIIGQSLSMTPDAKIEATMQHEITRLTSENLDLREVIDKQADQIRKLKKMLKVYAKRLKDGDAAEIQAELEREETQSVENVAQIKHRERNYMGMLEYKKEDESTLIKTLILDLKPKVAAGLLPGLPAYTLFMCVRHTDYINDDEKVRSLLTGTINGIKKVVKRHHDDLDRVALWLANTCRFLHTLKQYSGEKPFQQENTPRQNEHCLRNFDLAEYRQVFSDLAIWIYQTLIKLMEATIQPSIVAAVLEHEAIAGLTGSKPSGLRGRTGSRADEVHTPEHSLDSLMKSLNQFVRVLTQHAVDPELVKQIFKQIYYFLGASALNNLLLRKDMCNWSKGMQIRYNLSHLEQWLRDNKLQESGATTTLEPIVQASQLLQARKTEADVESVCDMCSKLTVPQIVKILNLYTPVDEFEERVPIVFIRKIQERLKSRQSVDHSLLMDLKFSYSVTFPFNPSKISLETVAIPQQLPMPFLARL